MSLLSRFTAWSTRPEVWRPVLLVALVLGLFRVAAPTFQVQTSTLLAGYLRHDAWALDKQTSSFLPLIEHVQQRVPIDEPILVDLEGGVAPLYWDRVLNYWLYPRKLYSRKALELQGEDVDAFARKKRIRWFYSEGELKHRGPASQPPLDPQMLPCSIHRASRPRIAFALLASLAHFAWVGACILAVIGATAALPSRLERGAAAFLVGAGSVGAWTLLCFVTGVGVSLASVGLSLPLATLGWWWSRGRRGEARPVEQRARRRASDIDWLAGVAALLLLLFFLVRAAALPMEGYDDRYQWAHKAHIMLHEQSVWGDGFQDPQTLHFHPRYPLLVPGVETVVFLYAGGFNDQYVKVLFPLFLGAFLILFIRGLEDLGRGRGRAVAGLALLALPFYAGYEFDRDGAAAFAAYPDLPLSVFVASAMLYLLRGQKRDSAGLVWLSALFVLLAALTKSEGVIHSAVLVATAMALFWRTAADSRAALGKLLPFALAAATIALYQLLVVFPTQPGIIPDDYPALLLSQPATSHLDRLANVLGRLASEVFASPRFGYLGLLLVGAAGFWRPSAGIAPVLPLAYTFGLALLFCVPYMLLPDHQWQDIYTWSAGRLIAQLLPMGMLAVALLVVPRRAPTAEDASAQTT